MHGRKQAQAQTPTLHHGSAKGILVKRQLPYRHAHNAVVGAFGLPKIQLTKSTMPTIISNVGAQVDCIRRHPLLESGERKRQQAAMFAQFNAFCGQPINGFTFWPASTNSNTLRNTARHHERTDNH